MAKALNVDQNSKTASVTGSFDSAVIRDRFQLPSAPTLLTQRASISPIGFTRLKSERVGHLRAKDVPREAAYSFHVALQPAEVDLWIDGKHVHGGSAEPGATFLFDLGANPVSEMHSSFDILRFYISKASLDELSFDRGQRRAGSFKACLGTHDRVMYGLATALVHQIEQIGGRNALFVDHIGLAFHAHVTDVYASTGAPACPDAGGLSPWQLRRTLDFLSSHLDGDPTIAELAQECGLSPGYFARAFRRTMGAAPHQWLIRKRIERARELLLNGNMDLAEIAIVCGFVDQSHFTRVFARREGCAPGRWRKSNWCRPGK